MRLLPSLVLLTALAQSSLASILAIDYGAEWTKISLVKPGLPFDVVLNKDSKRKVQSVVGWKKDERLFGGEASAVVSGPSSCAVMKEGIEAASSPSLWPLSLLSCVPSPFFLLS
jgi:hypothetical protein